MLQIGLFYKDYTRPGGMPLEYKFLVQELEKLGHYVTIYCYGDLNIVTKLSKQVCLKQFKDSNRWLFSLPKALKIDLINSNFDCFFIVSAHLPKNYVVSKALYKAAIKYVYCVGGAYNPLLLAKKPLIIKVYKHLIEIPILNNSDIIRSYSKTNTNFILNYGAKRPIFELLEGVHLENLSSIVSDKHFSHKHINLVYIGRIDFKGKGIDVLLECFNINEVSKLNIKLHIYGPFASNKDKILFNKNIKHFNDDLVEYHGPVYGNEKYSVLKSSDLFIYPSRYEGIPRSLREAMFFGVPMIVTKETNCAEYIINNEAGFVCECDPQSIYKTLVTYINHPDKKQLSVNSKSLTTNFYNWNSVGDRLKILLNRFMV